MQIGRWIFQPGWASTLAVLLLFPLLLSLGFWQLDRAQQKAELQAAFAERSQWPPAPLDGLDVADRDSLYRRVIATGYYDNGHQVLLDNQLREGRPGYHVLTPLRLPTGGAILVNRGWTPLGESRQTLPNITVTVEVITVKGWLAQPANPGLRLGDAAGADRNWPRVTPYIDYERLAVILGYPLQPAVILLEPNQPQGYLRDWRPRFGGFGPERHQGYAVQWFALAATLVILYFAAHIRRISANADEYTNPPD
jgi:surfeit locus 1 family protein